MVKIKVRRGLETNLPIFDEGEPGFTTDTKRAFFGSDEGNVELSKKEDVDSLNTTVTANGKKIKGFINIAEYDVSGDGVNDDLIPIVDAVADAITNGYALNWGWDGRTYLVTDTIPNFHTVKHNGNAIIKRGSDLFYISPAGTQTNKLYASPTGISTNDGLTADMPTSTIQKAFDYLTNYGPVLTGYWQINSAAGTYTNRAVLKDGLLSENPITLKGADVGGHPNVPTSLLSEGTNIAATGIKVTGGTKLIIQDFKVTGYNGNASSNGVSVADSRSKMWLINVHATDCYIGSSSIQQSMIDVKGGIFDHCGYTNAGSGGGYGVRSLQNSSHYVGDQNSTDITQQPIFRNCSIGFFAQENSTGHVKGDFYDNVDAVLLRVNSRANLDGVRFKRNTRDVRSTDGSNAYVTVTTSFGTGADESTNKIVLLNGGTVTLDTGVVITEATLGNSINEKLFKSSYVNQTVNTTVATVIHTSTLETPVWRFTPDSVSIGKKLYFRVYGVLNGANNNKRINVRLGSTLIGCTHGATESGVFQADGFVSFTGQSSQYVFIESECSFGTVRKSRALATNDMLTDTKLTLETYVDNAADSIVIDMIEVGWAG
jgi:hypothetical protein